MRICHVFSLRYQNEVESRIQGCAWFLWFLSHHYISRSVHASAGQVPRLGSFSPLHFNLQIKHLANAQVNQMWALVLAKRIHSLPLQRHSLECDGQTRLTCWSQTLCVHQTQVATADHKSSRPLSRDWRSYSSVATYGVALVSTIDQIVGLFCKRAL